MPDMFLDLAPPPPCAQSMASDDPDEVTSWVARRDGSHSRVVHGPGPYGFRLARIEASGVQVAWARARLASSLRARFPQPTFHLPFRGIQHYAYGRRRIEVAAGEVVFIGPDTEATRHSEGHPLMAIVLETSTFRAELQKRLAIDRVELQCVPRTPALSQLQKSDLIAAINGLVLAHSSGFAAASRLHGAGRVLSALAGVVIGSTTARVWSVSARRLSDLELWIDAHAAEPITLGMLCDVARVGERSLQAAFQARRGMSPMRFVAERRLAAAQRRLSSAGPGDDVTAVATGLGFTHLGRFSTAYRAAFGESPSRTLTRARQWSPARSIAASVRGGVGAATP